MPGTAEIRIAPLCALVLAIACSDSGQGFRVPDGARPGLPWPAEATSTGTGTDAGAADSGDPVPCASSDACAGAWCAADHRAGTVPGDADYTCRAECVPRERISLWCRDAGACCDAGATCDHGFCVVAGEETSTGG